MGISVLAKLMYSFDFYYYINNQNKIVGKVDFSLPNILSWLTKVNPTFECKYVQIGCKKVDIFVT